MNRAWHSDHNAAVEDLDLTVLTWALNDKCNCGTVTYGAVWTISRVGISFLYCVYIFYTHINTHINIF